MPRRIFGCTRSSYNLKALKCTIKSQSLKGLKHLPSLVGMIEEVDESCAWMSCERMGQGALGPVFLEQTVADKHNSICARAQMNGLCKFALDRQACRWHKQPVERQHPRAITTCTAYCRSGVIYELVKDRTASSDYLPMRWHESRKCKSI